MTDKELSGRERLKEAFELSDQVYLEKHPPTEEEIVYSKEYLKYMSRLIRKMRSPIRRFFITSGKRAVGIAAALMIFFGSVTVMAEGSVLHWVSEFYESYVKIYFEDDDVQKAPSTLETIYMPTYIPEGYILKQCLTETEWNQITWENELKKRIILYQTILDSQITIDNENSNFQTLFVDDLKIAISFAQDKKSYFWNTNEYFFSLITSKDISDEEIILIIKSIQKYETP
ncbi:MAG: DUF4367 domain-containing protein [Ruminococcaceae bacterium]|nr:DUF4367 domain-containing protein [Oscillospiraceae bacterium]